MTNSDDKILICCILHSSKRLTKTTLSAIQYASYSMTFVLVLSFPICFLLCLCLLYFLGLGSSFAPIPGPLHVCHL